MNSNYGRIFIWVRIGYAIQLYVVSYIFPLMVVCVQRSNFATKRVPFESHWTQTCLIDIFLTKIITTLDLCTRLMAFASDVHALFSFNISNWLYTPAFYYTLGIFFCVKWHTLRVHFIFNRLNVLWYLNVFNDDPNYSGWDGNFLMCRLLAKRLSCQSHIGCIASAVMVRLLWILHKLHLSLSLFRPFNVRNYSIIMMTMTIWGSCLGVPEKHAYTSTIYISTI